MLMRLSYPSIGSWISTGSVDQRSVFFDMVKFYFDISANITAGRLHTLRTGLNVCRLNNIETTRQFSNDTPILLINENNLAMLLVLGFSWSCANISFPWGIF